MRKIVCCVTTVLLLACASCSKNRIYPVSGKVTYNGAPAAGATVFFYPEGGAPANEHFIMGAVEPDGTFELVCGSLGKGAPAGQYDVTIEWKPRNKGHPRRGPDKLEGRYADRKAPLLHARVEASATIVPPFDLSDR